MPLYKIKNVNFNNIPLMDGTHLRVMWSHVIRHLNEFTMSNGFIPRMYVSKEAFDIINQSSSFSFKDPTSNNISNYLGHFMGHNVFSSDELYDDEYVVCRDEREIKYCRRKDKLKQIINKLNATL